MNKLTHAAAKTVFSGVVDYAIGQVPECTQDHTDESWI